MNVPAHSLLTSRPSQTGPDRETADPSLSSLTDTIFDDVPRLRRVHRAVSEARRGVPVLLTGDVPLIMVPAETASAAGLASFAAIAGEAAPLLVLARQRAADLMGGASTIDVSEATPGIQAIQLDDELLAPERLLGLADPTAEQLNGVPISPAAAPVLASAAVGLTKLARLLPAAVVAIAAPGADMIASRLDLLSVPAEDVLAYPSGIAASLRWVAEASVPLADAPDARIMAFRAADAGIEHLAIVIGDPASAVAPLVRLHSECFTGDLLGSLRCDCGEQLRGAITRMAAEGAGVLVYLAQEGRGIGLVNKLRAYTLQDRGLDTLDANRALGFGADERNFLIAATMLHELGMRTVRLLTNNPAKVAALTACGIEVAGRVTHAFAANGVNDGYLATKAARFGHLLG